MSKPEKSDETEGTWVCAMCTLINENSRKTCEVCASEKPTSDKRIMNTDENDTRVNDNHVQYGGYSKKVKQ